MGSILCNIRRTTVLVLLAKSTLAKLPSRATQNGLCLRDVATTPATPTKRQPAGTWSLNSLPCSWPKESSRRFVTKVSDLLRS